MLYDVEYKDRRLTLDELRTLAQCYNITINDILGVDIDSEQDTGYKRPDVDF
jgi:hypothetical protein